MSEAGIVADHESSSAHRDGHLVDWLAGNDLNAWDGGDKGFDVAALGLAPVGGRYAVSSLLQDTGELDPVGNGPAFSFRARAGEDEGAARIDIGATKRGRFPLRRNLVVECFGEKLPDTQGRVLFPGHGDLSVIEPCRNRLTGIRSGEASHWRPGPTSDKCAPYQALRIDHQIVFPLPQPATQQPGIPPLL